MLVKVFRFYALYEKISNGLMCEVDILCFLAPVEEDDDENESGTINQARGKRDIFECFWNGRLIPYTTVSE